MPLTPEDFEHFSDDQLAVDYMNTGMRGPQVELERRRAARLHSLLEDVKDSSNKLLESTAHLAKVSQGASESSTRMEFATWVILAATVVQLGIAIAPAINRLIRLMHYR